MRVPFAPRVSPEGVFAIAMLAAGVSTEEAARIFLASFGDFEFLRYETLVPVTIPAVGLLCLWLTRARESSAVVMRCIIGGSLTGLAVVVGTCVMLALRGRGGWFGSAEDFAIGAVLGFAFGLICICPGVELVRARRHRAHSDRDVQLVNTCTWLLVVSAPWNLIAFFSERPSLSAELEFVPWWFVDVRSWLLWPVAVPATVTVVAITVALCGLGRWVLRRRWLRHIFAGRVDGFLIEPERGARAGPLDVSVPVAELLSAWSEPCAVVRELPLHELPYRSPVGHVPILLLLPDASPRHSADSARP